MTLCCTSAPPANWKRVSPESTGHALSAAKQMCGLRAGGAGGVMAAPTRRASASRSSGKGAGIGPYIPCVDKFELLGDILDAGVRAYPALLVGDDRLARRVRLEDRLRQRLGGAAGHDLRRPREDVTDVRVIGAHHRHAEHHAFQHYIGKTLVARGQELHVALLEDGARI